MTRILTGNLLVQQAETMIIHSIPLDSERMSSLVGEHNVYVMSFSL